MLVKVTVKYDGSNYFGWQTQNGSNKFKTIEEVVNKCVSNINKKETEVVASGRTDSGVHALGQVFHFENYHDIPNDRLKNALNNSLPDDIEILDVETVSDDFHARFSAKSKEYHYYINVGEYDLFKKDYITQYNQPLDFDLMLKAAKILEGKHNFEAFNATPIYDKHNQVRTVNEIKIIKDKDLYIFKIIGDSFLRHMVRMIVGTIVFVGANKYSIKDVENFLDKSEVLKAPYNIEPNGLYLVKVNY